MQKKRNSKGFTLIELLIVIAVMAILTTVVFVALNPLQRFQDSRNSKRWSDVNAIIGAIKLYQVDHGGDLPGDYAANATNPAIAGVYYQISYGNSVGDGCTLPTACDQTITDCADLTDIVDDGYIPKMPFDPNPLNGDTADETETGYFIHQAANGAFTIGACHEELGSNSSIQQIAVTR